MESLGGEFPMTKPFHENDLECRDSKDGAPVLELVIAGIAVLAMVGVTAMVLMLFRGE